MLDDNKELKRLLQKKLKKYTRKNEAWNKLKIEMETIVKKNKGSFKRIASPNKSFKSSHTSRNHNGSSLLVDFSETIENRRKDLETKKRNIEKLVKKNQELNNKFCKQLKPGKENEKN